MNPKNYKLIQEAPKNLHNYVEAPEKETDDQFVQNLTLLLKQHTASIIAKNMSNDCADKVENVAIENGYQIMFKQIVVNTATECAPGKSCGDFYYELHSS